VSAVVAAWPSAALPALVVPALVIALLSWHARAARDQRLARACHELRGPLTAARLGVALAARSGGLTPEQFAAIEQELGRAGLVLEDLGRVDAHSRAVRSFRPEREHVDIGVVLQCSAEALRPVAAARGVSVRLRTPGGQVLVTGDRLRLAQLTGNLIANAIEHGGGAVDVNWCADTAAVRIEVSDDGPGLAGPIPALARRATRTDPARGHGLAIAAEIAAEHGGRLSAQPSERGARLVAEFPRPRAR
jgi:signal transduction histidine kinase